MRVTRVCLLLLLVLSLGLLACSRTPATETDPDAASTKVSIIESEEEETTESAPEDATEEGAETEVVTTEPPTETEAPPVEGEGGCQLRAAYAGDVTIPDDTVISAGESFVKTWRIRNSGTCNWETGTELVAISGEALGTTERVAVPPTAPEGTAEVSVEMVAPEEPGTYRSNWQLEAPDGTRFGGTFYVQIVVEEEPAPPTDFTGDVAADCSQVTFSWTDGQGEATYRLNGPGLSANLEADTSSYTWAGPPAGSATVTLIATDDGGSEIGRVTTTVDVSCTAPEPDLIVESISFDREPVAHLPVQVTVRVANRGGSASGDFQLRWWGGKSFSSPSCTWNVAGGVDPGASKDLECDFIYNSPYGSIASKAEADTGGAVSESDEGNNVLEKDTAVVNPVVVYDLVEEADEAVWHGGPPHVNLSWDGDTADNRGFATWVTSERWETGAAIQGKCLETHPRWAEDGYIYGDYVKIYQSGYRVEEGDRFRASVGLLQGAGAGDVTFRVMIRLEGGTNLWIASVRDTYDGSFKNIDVDLSEYVGKRADLVLRVEAGETAAQDWACWSRAAINRYP